MKAVIFTGIGPPSVLKYEENYPIPTRKHGEVLVRIHATSINPIEFKIRRGDIPVPAPFRPKILGADLAGVVEDADVSSKFKKGDRVFAHAAGTYAEYASVSEQMLVRIPSDTSYEEAAAVPLAGMTAWQALVCAKLVPGQRVLITAGAGGVGTFAVQIAKAWGMRVTATCGPKNIDFLKSLGADEVVDYTKDDIQKLFKDQPFDAVVDLVGGNSYFQCLSVTKPKGYYATVLTGAAPPNYPKLVGLGITFASMAYQKALGFIGWGPTLKVVLLTPKAQDFESLAYLMEEKKLKPVIDQVMPLSYAAKAHEYLEKGHARGKVILKVPADFTPAPAT